MSTIDLDVIQRLARLALANDEPYLYGRLVPLLAANLPGQGEWLAGYLRSLTRLGLNRVAAEVIERMSPDDRRRPEVEALAASVRSARPGYAPWKSRHRRFEANLAALVERDPAIAATVQAAWRAHAARFEMHQCSDGNVQVKAASAVWPPQWLPSLDDHRGAASRRINTANAGLIPPPLLFDGVGLGWEIEEGYKKTARVFLEASSAVYIVERRPEALAIALHIQDWRDLIRDPRVLLFLGEDASSQLSEFLAADASWPVTNVCHSLGLLGLCDSPPTATVMARVAGDRSQRAEQLRNDIAKCYHGRNATYWARRFDEAMDSTGKASEQPLRILGITSIHTTFLQYSMRDCLAALQHLGHQTELLIEPTAHQCLDATAALETQRKMEPDLILVLSRMRDEMPAIAHAAIPSVSWDQDSLPWVFDASRKPKLAWNDFLMGYAAAAAPRKFGWPKHRCKFCTLAGSADTYSPQPLPDEELAQYRCDVSYVSHASATVEEETNHAESWLGDPRLRPIFRAAVERLLPDWLAGGEFPGPIMSAVIDVCIERGHQVDADEVKKVVVAAGRIGDRAFRHVALNWVADWADRSGGSLHIWGNGWDKHPRFARYARGATRNGHELRCVYQASSINLQLIAYGFLHQRALDGLMAEAFFMARRSTVDDAGPLHREIVELVDRYSVGSPTDLAAIEDEDVRTRIATTMIKLGRDPRLVTPECVDTYRVNARCEYAAEVVPHFDEIAFTCAQAFERQAERFLADPETRAQYASQMRRALVDRYSYDTRMAAMLLFVRNGFQGEAEGSATADPELSSAMRA